MQCNCGEEKLVTVKKEGPNTGRKFYACAKPQGSQCDFFCWEGETPRTVKARTPQTPTGVQSQAMVEFSRKLDKVLDGQLELKQLLASIGAREAVKPSPSDKALPF